jgi:hypothetical protein
MSRKRSAADHIDGNAAAASSGRIPRGEEPGGAPARLCPLSAVDQRQVETGRQQLALAAPSPGADVADNGGVDGCGRMHVDVLVQRQGWGDSLQRSV